MGQLYKIVTKDGKSIGGLNVVESAIVAAAVLGDGATVRYRGYCKADIVWQCGVHASPFNSFNSAVSQLKQNRERVLIDQYARFVERMKKYEKCVEDVAK